MTRKFELQILDERQNMIDRFPLDRVISPSGLGFAQDLTIVETRTLDYIVDRTIKKKDIKLTVVFSEPQSYQKTNSFRSWYSRHIRDKVVLKYSDGSVDKYMDVAIKDISVSEINTGVNEVPMTLQPLSPFYKLQMQRILTSIESAGKVYPYAYPYAYGGGRMENNILDNEFFEAIPLYVKVNGPITNPTVNLSDMDDNIYATVKFNVVTLLQGQSIVIDGINTKILYYSSAAAEGADYYNYVDKSLNSFLYAQPGQSKLSANLVEGDPNSSVQIVFVQYVL